MFHYDISRLKRDAESQCLSWPSNATDRYQTSIWHFPREISINSLRLSAISSPRRDVDEDQHMEGVMAETRAWTVERVEKRHIFQSSRFEQTRVSNEFSVSLRAKNEDGGKYTGGYIVILRGGWPTCVKIFPINSMYVLAKLRTTDRMQSEHQ